MVWALAPCAMFCLFRIVIWAAVFKAEEQKEKGILARKRQVNETRESSCLEEEKPLG